MEAEKNGEVDVRILLRAIVQVGNAFVQHLGETELLVVSGNDHGKEQRRLLIQRGEVIRTSMNQSKDL